MVWRMGIPPDGVRDGGGGITGGKNYVSCLHNTFSQLIVTRPIMYLCLEAEKRPGSSVKNQCWEHDGLDVQSMQTAEPEAEQTEREKRRKGRRWTKSTGEKLARVTLGTYPNAPITYAMGLEHHHLIMITLKDTRGRFYR